MIQECKEFRNPGPLPGLQSVIQARAHRETHARTHAHERRRMRAEEREGHAKHTSGRPSFPQALPVTVALVDIAACGGG